MDQYEFRRELDAVLPSPDPRLAKRLIDFAEENKIYFSETEYKVVFYEEYLASLRFVAKNFGQDTLASIPKMIDEQNMILPDEMVAAAICVQGGVPVDQVQQMAYEGWLMGFFNARRVDNGALSPLAVCSIRDHGREEKFCTTYFGSFSPGDALHRAVEYLGEVYWTCRTHEVNKEGCAVKQIPQTAFYNAFCRLYYNLKQYGNPILNAMLTSLQTIRNRRMLWSSDVIELNKQISKLTSQNQMMAALKQQGLIDPDIFISQTNELTEQLRTLKLKKERLLVADGDNTITQTRELMDILEAGPDFLDHFDAELFGELIEKIIVDGNDQLRFRLKNGLELAETIEETVR